MLVGCVLRPIDSEVIYRWHPHLLSLAKDVKLGFTPVPTENRNPERPLAVHYTTAAPRHLPRRTCVQTDKMSVDSYCKLLYFDIFAFFREI